MTLFFTKLEPLAARLQTLWHRHATGASVVLGGREWLLEAGAKGAVSGATLYATLGSAECAVWLNDPDWKAAAGEVLGIDAGAAGELPETLLLAALECFAAEALSRVEAATGMACAVKELKAENSNAPASACRFRLRSPDGPALAGAWVVASADDEWRERIGGALGGLPARGGRLPDGLCVEGVVSLAAWRVGAGALAGLASGDVVLSPGGVERTLTVGGRIRFAARSDGGVLTVEGGTMAEMPDGAASGAELPASMDDVEVELRAEVGRVAVTLGQLRGLGAGQVVEFSTPVESPVVLSVNGKPFADGELVDVGGRVGVRITSARAGGGGA